MLFYVYVLHSSVHDKIYIGFTSDLEARLKSHNELSRKGWTVRYRPWVIVHFEIFQTKKEAMVREKELKSAKGRHYIWNQIIISKT